MDAKTYVLPTDRKKKTEREKNNRGGFRRGQRQVDKLIDDRDRKTRNVLPLYLYPGLSNVIGKDQSPGITAKLSQRHC